MKNVVRARKFETYIHNANLDWEDHLHRRRKGYIVSVSGLGAEIHIGDIKRGLY